MLLSAGDRVVIIAALQAQALEYDRRAKAQQGWGRQVDAVQSAAFSRECARLADIFGKEK